MICFGQTDNVPVSNAARNVHSLLFVLFEAVKLLNDDNEVGALFVADSTFEAPVRII